MTRSIRRITLKGFKSIRSLEAFELHDINVLIGANGSGKSNFVSLFTFLRELVEEHLEFVVNDAGGADAILFLGPKVTHQIEAAFQFWRNGYSFALTPTADNRLVFSDERIQFRGDITDIDRSIGAGHRESKLRAMTQAQGDRSQNIASHVHYAVSRWTVYHFHDTSRTAGMRRQGSVRDNEYLRPDGSNLAAFLFRLRAEQKGTYDLIGDAVRLVAPFFGQFKLRPRPRNGDEYLELEWEQKNSDYPFHPSQLSDGTLRFIALATALLQPAPPATILIDEPELGLHPYALDVLANLILQAGQRTQVIVCTQSPALLNAFRPDQIVVLDREAGETRFRRLDEVELREWLTDEYTLGDLWQKNVYGGGPAHE